MGDRSMFTAHGNGKGDAPRHNQPVYAKNYPAKAKGKLYGKLRFNKTVKKIYKYA